MDLLSEYDKDLVRLPKIRMISELNPRELKLFMDEEIACPHCKKRIQRKDAVVATKTERHSVDTHVQYLPAGGKRVREKYYLDEKHYFRCSDCDKTIKRIEEINNRADRLGRRIGLSVLFASFVIGMIATLLSVNPVGWEEVLGSLFVWGMGSIVLGVVLMAFLPKYFSKDAERMKRDAMIDLSPSIEEANADYIIEESTQ